MKHFRTRLTKARAAALLAAAAALAGCDRFAAARNAGERSDGMYQAAMADYAAGRVDAAISGFEKVVRANPVNASARFQLATLLQDRRKDYLSALCHYREYLLQCPSSDKSELADERARMCERQFASVLVAKAKEGEGAIAEELTRLRAESEKASKEAARLQAELATAVKERDAAKREGENLRKMLGSVGDGESSARPEIASARALLDADDEEPVVDRVKLSADVKNLLAEENAENTSTPFAVAPKKPREEPAPAAPAEPPHEPRPETYVVQEGDTLYKIAMRFYGRRSAWTKIRDANKTAISTDGRVNAGETIRLPQ